MPLSSVVLSDPDSVGLDGGARSVSYFCRRNPVRVNAQLVSELKEIAAKHGGRNVRLCLHEGPEAAFHEMIVLEHGGTYYRPHKHLTKGESYHLIEGSMAVFVFDEAGRVVDVCLLDAADNFLYRVGTNMFHAVMPLSEMVIYHESKPGPFIGEGDSVYPDWAPDGSSPEDVANYTSDLRHALRGSMR